MEDLLLKTCIPVSGIVIGQDGSEEMNKHVAISENSSVKFLCCYTSMWWKSLVEFE